MPGAESARGRTAGRAGGGAPGGAKAGLGDVVAGVSMAAVLVPQALAYAQVAGLPAHVGLYAAALPPLAAAFFASSPYLQTGPAAVTAILTAGALTPLAATGSREYVLLAALLALVVGATRVAIGLLRAGRIVFLMSEPVVRGFTVGAALLILASQIPAVLGLEAGGDGAGGTGLPAAVAALARPGSWNPASVLAGASTIALVLVARRIHPLVPGILLATAAGIAASRLGFYDGATIGPVPEGLPPFSLALPWRTTPSLLLAGVVIALAGFSEAASIARTYAARERQHWDPDREFVSQGVANLAAGISGGFPVGGSFSRSSLAHMAGARTRWSGGVTGLVVMAFLPFASILAPLPLAVLAALVIAAVSGLVRVRPILSLWRLSRPQFGVAAATFVLTLVLSPHIEQAVVLGILLAGAVHFWREFHISVDHWSDDGTLHLRPHGVLWFGSAELLKSSVSERVADAPDARRICLHMERLGRVDITAALALDAMIADLHGAHLDVDIRGIHPETARALRRVVGHAETSSPEPGDVHAAPGGPPAPRVPSSGRDDPGGPL